MDRELDAMGMLDLMVRPAFCVKDTVIVRANPAAESLLFRPGLQILPLIEAGSEEYQEFTGGCLYLTLLSSGARMGASVTRSAGVDIFLLEEEADRSELQAMALAARELREPLANIMATAQQLLPIVALDEDPKTKTQAAQLNRGLHQMLRIIGNMTDAQRYSTLPQQQMETLNITQFLREVFDNAQTLASHSGILLHFSTPDQELYTLADREKLERAVLNILSNALKFTPVGGTIEARLARRGKQIALSIQDSGQGIPNPLRGQLHRRYLRQPGLEDSRFGIGLGMVLIRSAAAIHGGAVLIDHPEGAGTRVTMTLAIRQGTPAGFRSPLLRIDYAGEQDHALIELSDSLPPEVYDTKKI